MTTLWYVICVFIFLSYTHAQAQDLDSAESEVTTATPDLAIDNLTNDLPYTDVTDGSSTTDTTVAFTDVVDTTSSPIDIDISATVSDAPFTTNPTHRLTTKITPVTSTKISTKRQTTPLTAATTVVNKSINNYPVVNTIICLILISILI